MIPLKQMALWCDQAKWWRAYLGEIKTEKRGRRKKRHKWWKHSDSPAVWAELSPSLWLQSAVVLIALRLCYDGLYPYSDDTFMLLWFFWIKICILARVMGFNYLSLVTNWILISLRITFSLLYLNYFNELLMFEYTKLCC